MASYLLIESRDTFEYGEPTYFYQLAQDLARRGNDVTFYLVQNGVIPARKGTANSPVARLRQQAPKVRVLADDFSLRERAISSDKLLGGVTPISMDDFVELLATPGTKAVWH